MPRYASRIDGNQNEIVDGLRKAGVSVAITSTVGNGFPDLVCGLRGETYLLEIKDPSRPKADRQLTPDQVKFFDGWRGHAAKVETLEEAIHEIFYMRNLNGNKRN